MAVRMKIDPISKEDILFLTADLSPGERSRTLAAAARENLRQAQETNRSVLGMIPPHETFVDGRAGASEDSVRPDGEIVYEFELMNEMFEWIGQLLVENSPFLTGRYQDSFVFTVDGDVVDPGAPLPEGEEFVFTNVQPYARKVERGLSNQAPDGVFQVVAAMASSRFGNLAKIRFSYRAPLFGAIEAWASQTAMESPYRRGAKRDEWLRRQPAIVITR